MNDIENGMLFYTEEEPEEFCKCAYCGDTIQFLSGKRIIMEVDVENLAKQFDVEINE